MAAVRRELICLEPASPARLQVREVALPRPAAGQVLVRVQATGVNPIDARRAGGYGQRLLRLKGAGRFPLVLGNDLAGRVEAVGRGVAGFEPGQPVFGLVGSGKGGGTHASHVLVPPATLRAAPPGIDMDTLAVLPYSFTTMRLAVQQVQLTPENAAGKRVLILGAAGALGRLALQLLSGWGCRVTAICDADAVNDCLSLGAGAAIARGAQLIRSLPSDFHAVLNFASWDEELALASRLDSQALGHATTVHPLLGHCDRLGLLRGALASVRDKALVRSAVRERSATAHYAWTIFKPDSDALDTLAAGLQQGHFRLPVGLSVGLDRAALAFAHVAVGRPGRAVLQP